ncbi:Probable glutathione S-transferase [Linum perenne]
MEGDDAEVVLLDVDGSPFATRVRIALLEKGIDHQSRYEELSNKSSLLLQMNPVHSKIPVLIHRGRMLWTSIVEVKEALIDCFRVLERELGDKPFLSGESFGFIDIVFISFYGFFYTFQELGNFKLEAECPKIVHWTQRCLQRESVPSL